MIAFAKVGLRADIAKALDELKGTEKNDAMILPDVKAFMGKQIAALPEDVSGAAVDIKARTLPGNNWHLEVFVQPRALETQKES